MNTRHDAYQLLESLGAYPRLILHLQLVVETAAELIHAYNRMGIQFDTKMVELGATVHDAGKIEHPAGLNSPGSLHERAGKEFLLLHGVPATIAHFCVSHAAWNHPELFFEERTVALADKLWKGKREQDLELAIIDEAASRLRCGRWDVFPAAG